MIGLQATGFVVDILMAGLILIDFSPTWQTGAPALLPLLAYEGMAYWDAMGAVAGWVTSMALLLATRRYQTVTSGQHFSISLVGFWAVAVTMLIALPAVTMWLKTHLASEQTSSASMAQTEQLTRREQEILSLLRQGHTQNAIAEICHIEIGTVKTHVHHIYQKLGVQRREDLIPNTQDDAN